MRIPGPNVDYFGHVIVAAILIALAFLAWFLSGADAAVQSAVVAALVVVFSTIFAYWNERTRAIREAHRESKLDVYRSFVDMAFGKSEITEPKMGGFRVDLMFFGSPEVILTFNAWQRMTSAVSAPAEGGNLDAAGAGKLNLQTERVVRAMREDIGLSNRGLGEGDLLGIRVKDSS